MLIDFDARNGRQIDHIARMSHSQGQFLRFFIGHALEIDGHEPGCGLIVSDAAGRIIVDEARNFLFRQDLAVPLVFDAVDGPHRITSVLIKS